MPTRHRPLLYAITWLTDFAVFMAVFSVSRALAEAGEALSTMGVIGGSISLAVGFGALAGGRLSDRFDARRVLLVGTIGFLASLAACSMLRPNHVLFYALYVAIGLASGAIYPSVLAALGRTAAEGSDHRTVSGPLVRFCLAWNGGMVSGQFAGGWLFDLGPSWPMRAGAVLALVNVLLVLAMRGSGSRPAPGPSEHTPAQRVHRERSATFARMAWLANLGGTFAMSMVLHLFPSLMVELKVLPHRHGTLLAISRVVVIAMYLVMHRLTFWHHRFWVNGVSQAVAILGLVLIATGQGLWPITIGLLCLSQLVGYNYFASLYYSTTGAIQERKGAASGLHEASLALGLAAGSIVGGLVGDLLGGRAPYHLAACVIATVLAAQGGLITIRARVAEKARVARVLEPDPGAARE